MSHRAVYLLNDSTSSEVGLLVAGADEFIAFRAWVVERFSRYPEAAWLVGSDQWPGSGTTRAELFEPLASELGEIALEAQDDFPDVAGVAAALSRALRERPPGSVEFTLRPE